jgi:hypothetical protein
MSQTSNHREPEGEHAHHVFLKESRTRIAALYISSVLVGSVFLWYLSNMGSASVTLARILHLCIVLDRRPGIRDLTPPRCWAGVMVCELGCYLKGGGRGLNVGLSNEILQNGAY